MNVKTLKSAEPVKLDDLLKREVEPGMIIERAEDGDVIARKQTGTSIILASEALKEVDLQKLADQRGFEWSPERAERVVPYWASDERVDRMGDVVNQNWNFKHYEQNPIMLFSHDWSAPAIGGVLDWAVMNRSEGDYKGPALRLLSVFATKEEYEWADTIYRLQRAGYMRSGSVGFYPKDVYTVKDPKERQELGLGKNGVIFDTNSLVEWSPCSVPANPGAHRGLANLRLQKSVRPEDITVLRELIRQESRGDEEQWSKRDAEIRGAWTMLYPGTRFLEHKDLDEPIHPDEMEYKYSEDQPRDENGRFAGGGDGGSSGDAGGGGGGESNAGSNAGSSEGHWVLTPAEKALRQATNDITELFAREGSIGASKYSNEFVVTTQQSAFRAAGIPIDTHEKTYASNEEVSKQIAELHKTVGNAGFKWAGNSTVNSPSGSNGAIAFYQLKTNTILIVERKTSNATQKTTFKPFLLTPSKKTKSMQEEIPSAELRDLSERVGNMEQVLGDIRELLEERKTNPPDDEQHSSGDPSVRAAAGLLRLAGN